MSEYGSVPGGKSISDRVTWRKLSGIARGELTRLVRADDVVRNGRNSGGTLRRRSQGAERSDDGHPNIVVKAVCCQLAISSQLSAVS